MFEVISLTSTSENEIINLFDFFKTSIAKLKLPAAVWAGVEEGLASAKSRIDLDQELLGLQ